MNYYFITGSSKGLGKAIAELLLQNSNNIIYGLSRSNNIIHDNFIYIDIDLSDIEKISKYIFPQITNANKISLINNAGVIGEIKTVGNKNALKISETFNINSISPNLLMNQFINQFQDLPIEKSIINISSGAGRHPINSWAEYCASKAALDMFSSVIAQEQISKENPFFTFSVAPGIIDTEMQNEIRLSTHNDFDKLDYFKDLKKNNLLSSAKEIASKISKILENPTQFKNTLLDVRDF